MIDDVTTDADIKVMTSPPPRPLVTGFALFSHHTLADVSRYRGNYDVWTRTGEIPEMWKAIWIKFEKVQEIRIQQRNSNENNKMAAIESFEFPQNMNSSSSSSWFCFFTLKQLQQKFIIEKALIISSGLTIAGVANNVVRGWGQQVPVWGKTYILWGVSSIFIR